MDIFEDDVDGPWECHVCGHVYRVERLRSSPFDDGTEVGFDIPVPARCPACAAPFRLKLEELNDTLVLQLMWAMYGLETGNRLRPTDHIPGAFLEIYTVHEPAIDRAVQAAIKRFKKQPYRACDSLATEGDPEMRSVLADLEIRVEPDLITRTKAAADRLARDAMSGVLEWRLRETGKRLKAQIRFEQTHYRELRRRRQHECAQEKVGTAQEQKTENN